MHYVPILYHLISYTLHRSEVPELTLVLDTITNHSEKSVHVILRYRLDNHGETARR